LVASRYQINIHVSPKWRQQADVLVSFVYPCLEEQAVDVDLFIKKMPHVVKELISREAFDNRRSINQEAIALLEEALVNRVGAAGAKRKHMEAVLSDAMGAGIASSRNPAQT
jgi:hypothetical protein